jgi:hypothetical protein
MRYKPQYTIRDIRRMVFQAESGSPSVYDKLDAEWAKLAKITNRRMKELEKEELDFYDYDRMYTHIKNEFSPRRKRMPDHVSTATMDRESIIDNFEQMLTFVEAPSSTVSGATEKMNMQLRKFEEFTGTIIEPQYKKKFARLVTDDRISDLLDMARYESGDTIDAIYYLAEHDIDIYKQDVRTRIDDLISGEENIDDFLEYLRSIK